MRTQLVIFIACLFYFNTVSGQSPHIITVTGNISPSQTGVSLSHEHLLVDFIGAANYSRSRWNEEEAFQQIIPFVEEAKSLGVKTLFDCTPNYLGRDPKLLERVALASQINIVTNTGLYGGSDNKFLPAYAFSESAEQLAQRWIAEFKNGIDGTSVRPGFIKISVNPGPLSEISKKLITAAAITHKATGLTIASHTGPALPAREQIEILSQHAVKPDAFIWVHAQNEKQTRQFVELAKAGAWVSLDGVNDENISFYVDVLSLLKKEKMLHRVLISHDAGWFDPGKTKGGVFRPFTAIFKKLIPALQHVGFTQKDIDQLLISNPATAYTIAVRDF